MKDGIQKNNNRNKRKKTEEKGKGKLKGKKGKEIIEERERKWMM